MNAKITLYSDKELIAKIKQLTKKRNTSVSALVTEFFKTLLEKESQAPITDSLSGILKGKTVDKSYKKHLEEKYL